MSLPIETIGGIIGASITAVMGVFKAFRFVREGERGIKLQFGKAIRDDKGVPIVIEPGFVLLVPFMQTIAAHHVRQQSYRFPEQRITLKDGLIYKVGGMVIFKVVNVYKALFEIESIDHSIDDLCMAAIKDELEQLTHERLTERDELSRKLLARVQKRAEEWGIEILQFSLPECAPTPETANLINANLSVKMRLDALTKGLKEHGLTIKDTGPNLAAVLIGIPLTATVVSEPTNNGSEDTPSAGHIETESSD